MKKLLKDNSYEHILRKYETDRDLMEWYEGETARLGDQLRENLDTPKEDFYRQMEKFRQRFHKPVIYASWDWSGTVEDALRQAGFTSYEEQAQALEVQRQKKW